MINNKRVLAAILAPKVFGGLVKKNFREVNGCTLLELAIQAALASNSVDKVVVITDDSDAKLLANKLGVTTIDDFVFKHPEKQVQVDKCGASLVQSNAEFDYFVLLDVSTPLRLPKDIDHALELSIKSNGSSVVTVSDTGLAETDLHYVDSARGLGKVKAGSANKIQLNRKLYELNYSVMVSSKEKLLSSGTFFGKETKAYLIPKDRALYVDSKLDLAIAQTLVSKKFFQLPAYLDFKVAPQS